MGRCTGRRCPMQVGYDVANCNQFDCIYRTEINTNYDRIKSMSVEEMAEEYAKSYPPLKDNEIIKALECCGFDEDMCLDCPVQCDCEKDTEAMIDRAKAILDLINRKDAEIAELQSELIITKNNFDNVKDRYDEAVKIGQKMNEKLINAYKKLQTAKTEARKEFAERLKEKCSELPFVDSVSAEDIDNLLAEMESERE